ncbi:MAG: DEAD/DEAH box helicase [bacterium]
MRQYQHTTNHTKNYGTAVDLRDFLYKIRQDGRLAPDIAFHKVLSGKGARFQDLNPPLPASLQKALETNGVKNLYLHQAEGIQLAREKCNVVTVTPTASGKTLVYTLPILERIITDPDTRALLLFPLKALAQDQLKRIQELATVLGLSQSSLAAIYDGDTSSYQRAKIRKNPANIILTNPDMVHHGLLPFHTQWSDFFTNLHYVVIDELHTYKGVFGSHVLQILRRLRRVASFYHAKPQFLATSATIANPRELAEQLTGLGFNLVEENGAPSATRHIFFVNPTASLYTSATHLFTEAMKAGQKTIVFTKARKITELIYQWTLRSHSKLKNKISAYRAGYLPTERREIEHKLQSGVLNGVISTSALEMGIDIGGLDVCILVGYPGTITNTWQRAGRVGRKERDSAIFLIAQPDALDQYFMRHPNDFFRRGAEAGVVDETNPYLLKNHLVCAAQEAPLRRDDTVYNVTALQTIITELTETRDLIEAAGGAVWFSARKRPQRDVDIRGAGSTFTIMEKEKRYLIGHLSGRQALTECHTGAIYLHGGQTFLVTELDLSTHNVWVEKADVSYYTIAHTDKETEILTILDSRENNYYKVSLGRLKVTERATGFEKRNTAGREKISEHELDLPPIVYETVGLWIEPPTLTMDELTDNKHHPMGSIHAIEHASLAMLPLFALCDRNDVGGISFTRHPQLEDAAIFLYDGHPGGVGLAAKAYEVLDQLLAKVLALVEECPCSDGCPSCIHSPKCGHGNVPLDKGGCVRLLQHLHGKRECIDAPHLSIRKTEKNGTKKESEPLIREISIPYTNKLPLIKGRDIVVFDLETQLSAQEVGGWHNAHLMRVSVGVLFEHQSGNYITYMEDTISDLIERLLKAELIVGFNQKRFDYTVLRAYTGEDLSALPCCDLLEEIHNRLGFRLGLGAVASATLGSPKSADGLDALRWWKEGNIEEIKRYCRRDVELTANLFDHVMEKGYLLYTNKTHGIVRLPMDIAL